MTIHTNKKTRDVGELLRRRAIEERFGVLLKKRDDFSGEGYAVLEKARGENFKDAGIYYHLDQVVDFLEKREWNRGSNRYITNETIRNSSPDAKVIIWADKKIEQPAMTLDRNEFRILTGKWGNFQSGLYAIKIRPRTRGMVTAEYVSGKYADEDRIAIKYGSSVLSRLGVELFKVLAGGWHPKDFSPVRMVIRRLEGLPDGTQ